MRTTKVQIRLRVVVGFLDSIIHVLVMDEISRLNVTSIAEQAGLSLTWSQFPKTGFIGTWLKFK